MRKEENVSNAEKETRHVIQKLKGEQGQVVNAFLGYFQGGSIVSHSTFNQLKPLYLNCQELSSLTEFSALPAIVVAAAHLPAAWSSLPFSSRGVLMDSRFDSSIASSMSFNAPYVLDTLARAVKEVVALGAVPAAVLMVLLQGIALVHLAMKLASEEIDLPTRPRILLKTLSQHLSHSLESVLGSIYKQVHKLIFSETKIVSWLSSDLFTDAKLGSSNSALPEGVSLIHRETPGSMLLIGSMDDRERLFVIETQTVNFQ